MHVSKSIKSATNVVLNVSATGVELEPIKKHVLGHFVDKVKIPGFRTGKAPLPMVEKNVDQKAFLDEFLEHAINDFYRKAVEQEKLRPIAQPKVQVKKFVPYSDLEFEADIEAVGEMKLPDYRKMKLAKKSVSVTAKDVNEVIESLKKRMAQRMDVDRAAKNGDEVIIDFSGTEEKGKAVAGAKGADYPLVLGSNAFIPGFEEQVVGLKAGEKKDFDVRFPKDYGVKALQSKKVIFSVEVKKVQELKEPKADDTFAAQAGPFKTLAELKADIKKQLSTERQTQANREYENELVKKITDKTEVQIPEILIEQQITRLEDEEKRNLAYRGQTWQEHLEEEGINEEEHRVRHRPDAELRVKAGLVLSEIAERENLNVGPEELEIRLQMLRGQYQDPAMQAQLNLPENQQDIAAQLLTEKTVAKLVEYASK